MEPEVIKKTHCGEVDSKKPVCTKLFCSDGFQKQYKAAWNYFKALQPVYGNCSTAVEHQTNDTEIKGSIPPETSSCLVSSG